MNIDNLKNLKLENLKEFSPGAYQELEASGDLDQYLDSTARAAKVELDSLTSGGYSTDQAWEVVREDFLMPLDDPLSMPDEEENPNAGILSALNEAIVVGNRALEDLGEVPSGADRESEE